MNGLCIERKKIVVPAMYFIAFLLGIETGGLQYSVLKMAGEFHLNSAQMGSIVSVYFFATMLSPIFTGALSDKIGKKKIMIAALIVFLAGCVIASMSHVLMILYAGVFVMGLAFAAMESSSTAALSDYAPEKSGKYISIMQSILSAGCFASPLILYFLMDDMGFDWRVLFFMCMILAVLSLIIVVAAVFGDNRDISENSSLDIDEAGNSKPMKIEAYLILMVLCIAVYVFMENGITFFADSFISVDLDRPDAAALALSMFWAAMAVARFTAGLLYKYENIIIKLGFIFTALLLVSLSFVDNVTVVLGIYLLLGVTCAPIWPLITSKLNRTYKANTGLVTGLVLIAGGVGGTISPYVIGMINDVSNMTIAFISLAAIAAGGLIVFIVIHRGKRSGQSE